MTAEQQVQDAAEQFIDEGADASQYFEEGDNALAIDMDGIEAAKFELIPQGTYECVIEELECKPSAASGKLCWYMKLAIVDGAFEGRKLFNNMSFSEAALPYTKASLMKIAPDVLHIRPFIPQKIADDGILVGRRLRVKTSIEAYEGEKRTKVKQLLASAEAGGDFITS